MESPKRLAAILLIACATSAGAVTTSGWHTVVMSTAKDSLQTNGAPITTLAVEGLTVSNSFELADAGRVTNYIWAGANAVQAPGAQPATLATRGAGLAFSFADNLTKDVRANIRVPSGIDYTVGPDLCLGWSTATTNAVCHWEVTYLTTSLNDSVLGATTTCTNLATSSTTANGLNLSTHCGLPAASGNLCWHMTITRVGGAADDTIGATVYLEGIAIRFTQKAIGD